MVALYNGLRDFLKKSDKIYYRNCRCNDVELRFFEISIYFLFTRISLRNFAGKKYADIFTKRKAVRDGVYGERSLLACVY